MAHSPATLDAWQRRQRTWLTTSSPHLPVRQWVLPVPKRLRYFLQRDGAALNIALRILLWVIQHSLCEHCLKCGAGRQGMHANRCRRVHPPLRLQSEYGCSLPRLRGRWVFEAVPGDDKSGDHDADAETAPKGVIFHPASGLDETGSNRTRRRGRSAHQLVNGEGDWLSARPWGGFGSVAHQTAQSSRPDCTF